MWRTAGAVALERRPRAHTRGDAQPGSGTDRRHRGRRRAIARRHRVAAVTGKRARISRRSASCGRPSTPPGAGRGKRRHRHQLPPERDRWPGACDMPATAARPRPQATNEARAPPLNAGRRSQSFGQRDARDSMSHEGNDQMARFPPCRRDRGTPHAPAVRPRSSDPIHPAPARSPAGHRGPGSSGTPCAAMSASTPASGSRPAPTPKVPGMRPPRRSPSAMAAQYALSAWRCHFGTGTSASTASGAAWSQPNARHCGSKCPTTEHAIPGLRPPIPPIGAAGLRPCAEPKNPASPKAPTVPSGRR